mgnify:CR=1 FL=1
MPASLSIISAMDENRLIGRDNALPWHLPADLAFFKKNTLNKPILMGRKTYESIGRPLPGRRNIIISRDELYKVEGCDSATSIAQALDMVKNQPEAMLIGGASLYQQTLEIAEKLYITFIHDTFEGDAWFPEIDQNIWVESSRVSHDADEKNPHNYSFVTYSRRL